MGLSWSRSFRGRLRRRRRRFESRTFEDELRHVHVEVAEQGGGVSWFLVFHIGRRPRVRDLRLEKLDLEADDGVENDVGLLGGGDLATMII